MARLGDVVKDKITGFEGVAIAQTEYINGCKRILVQPANLTSDGAMLVAEWIDESQVVGARELKDEEAGADLAPGKPRRVERLPGGPGRTPTSIDPHSHPPR